MPGITGELGSRRLVSRRLVSPRTVFRPPLLLSSGSHRNRLFTRMYTDLYVGIALSTHGRDETQPDWGNCVFV